MQTQHTFIALYDANPEHAHFESPIFAGRARALGRALADARFGIVSRIGSPTVATVFDALSESGIASIALSPGSSREEHMQAFRLPDVSAPLVFTGRGGLGADLMALASAHAVIIVGSHPEALSPIFRYVNGRSLPIGIISDEDPASLRERLASAHPEVRANDLFVSHDPLFVVGGISDELRRRRFE